MGNIFVASLALYLCYSLPMNEFFQKTENIFVIFCLFWGMLFLFINPPFQANDEPEHMYKMYGFTQGTLNFQEKTIEGKKQTGLVLPVNLVSIAQREKRLVLHPQKKTSLSETKMLSKISLNPQVKSFKGFAIPAYTPVSYFPGFILLWVMKLFKIAPLSMMYILRFCTLLTYISMIYFAIKITPVKKWLFFAAAVVPQAIYLGSAINTDAIVTGFAFLATAYTFYIAYDKSVEKITKKQMTILGLLFTLVNICKFPYIVMCLLLLIIPQEKFKSEKSRFLFIAGVFLLNIVIDFIILFSYFIHINKVSVMNSTNSLPAFQAVHVVLQNPILYIKFLFANFILGGYYYLQGLCAYFGWSDVAVPAWVIYFYVLLLATCGFINDKNEPEFKISVRSKIIFISVIVLMTLITAFTCFVLFSEISSHGLTIYRGKLFQGRYWIPLMPIIFLIFNNNKFRFNLKWFKIITINLFNFLMFVCTIIILYRYYV